MLTCIATGTLVRPPQKRQASNGNDYCIFLLRIPIEGEETLLANCIAFHRDAVEAILELGERDTVAVSGSAKLSHWKRDGEDRHGVSITVDKILTAYGVAKQRKTTREESHE